MEQVLLSSEEAKPLAKQLKEFYDKHFNNKKGKGRGHSYSSDSSKQGDKIILADF